MYQYSGIDVYNSFAAEDRLHNSKEQELVGINDRNYMIQRSDNGRSVSHASSSYMVRCFRR